MTLTWYIYFQRNGGLNQILRAKSLASITFKRFRCHYISFFLQYCDKIGIIVVNAVLFENASFISSLQNGSTERSSSYTIWFQMRCWMTSCLNRNYIILIFIHFHIYFMWTSIVYYRQCRDRIFFDKILVSEYRHFKRSNKANLVIAMVQYPVSQIKMTFQEIKIIATGPCNCEM